MFLEYKSSCSLKQQQQHYIECSSVQTCLTKDFFLHINIAQNTLCEYFGRVIKAWSDKLLDKG